MIRSTCLAARRRLFRAAAYALVVGSFSADARADSAEDLFQRGRDLLDQGHLSEACDTLAKAEVLKPSVGTVGLLAACHEKQGRLATAWREYQETAKRAAGKHDERERFALDRAAKLEPQIPRLLLRLPEGEQLTVSVAGVVLDKSTLAAAVRLDPGKIVVSVTSPHDKHWSTTTELGPSEERVVEVPSLEPPQKEAPHRSAVPPPPAIIALSVGVVGFGVMTGFGLSAMKQNSDSIKVEARCKDGSVRGSACTVGERERDRARTFGNVATAGLAVGAAGIATGALLWIFDVGGGSRPASPAAPPSTGAIHWAPNVSPEGASLAVSGLF